MKCVLIISQDEPMLADEEITTLINPKIIEKDSAYWICEVDDNKLELLERLAYTKVSMQYMFRCNFKEIENKIGSFDYNPFYNESFVVRCSELRLGDVEKKLADLVWEKINNPKVDLKNPKTKIYFQRNDDTIYCGKLIAESYAKFEFRRNKYKPKKHPTTMHPKFARFLINISGVNSGTLLDPFCGAGGILLEGSVLGYKIIGYDISQEMLNRCEENLTFFKKTDYIVRKRDAAKIMDESDLVVTDVPYGKCSTLVDSLVNTYKGFLESSYKMVNRMVVVFPHYVDYKKLFGKWKLQKELSLKIHGGLTRKVCVLSK